MRLEAIADWQAHAAARRRAALAKRRAGLRYRGGVVEAIAELAQAQALRKIGGLQAK